MPLSISPTGIAGYLERRIREVWIARRNTELCRERARLRKLFAVSPAREDI